MGNRKDRIRKIIELIESQKISSEEGLKLYQQIDSDSIAELYEKDPSNQPITSVEKGDENEPLKDIAIIGVSGRFPQAEDIHELWNNLAKAKDSVSGLPFDRWGLNPDSFFEHEDGKLMTCKWGAFISDIDKFDPLFFSISPQEAEFMDPRQRLFLMEAWRALEDAGYSDRDLDGSRCSVFVGCQEGDYLHSYKGERNRFIPGGSSNAILAARISYLLNLKGPSIAVDTACSSSLVATYLAYESVRTGISDIAIAGGVSLMATPLMLLRLSKTGMMTTSGKCRAFDNDADGFVPGEGVGVVILKTLDRALSDGNHIYGIIKSAGVNQDGKTNGINAPSATSQTELEYDVYKKGNINPETINYIETHGTGTKLGDPIEVSALIDSFCKFTDKKGFCSIGSIKTNIGHLTPASGIAGLIKILISLKHEMIPASLHCDRTNEHIDFQNSPFYVNTRLTPWKRGGGCPRRAAVSSFGFSGTNVHMVIEEAPEIERRVTPGNPPYYLVCVSAKTPEALSRKLQDLNEFLEREPGTSLLDLSYTLLAGRSHFNHRISMVIKDYTELKYLLEKVLDNRETGSVIRNTIKKDVKALNPSLLDKLAGSAEDTPVEFRKKLLKIGALYAHGHTLPVNEIFDTKICRYISLPGYPFAKESCWLRAGNAERGNPELKKTRGVHPLIDCNTSDLEKQQFTTILTGDEFFLEDHNIGGVKVLPGAVLLEMARAAGALASKNPIRRITNIFWTKALKIEQSPLKLLINLFPENRNIIFEIFSSYENGEEILHARGSMEYGVCEEQESALDIESVKSRCEVQMEGVDCYTFFDKNGIKYGNSFKGIKHIRYNKKEVLSRIELAGGIYPGQDQYILFPGLLDSAFQTIVGFNKSKDAKSRPILLPFALDEIIIYDAIPGKAYVYTFPGFNTNTENSLEKYNIAICDEKGRIVVRLNGFTCRSMISENNSGPGNSKNFLFGTKAWKIKALEENGKGGSFVESRFLVADKSLIEDLPEGELSFGEVPALDGEIKDLPEKVESVFLSLFKIVKESLKRKSEKKQQILVLVPDNNENHIYSFLSGFFKTMNIEYPLFTGKILYYPELSSTNKAAFEAILKAEGNCVNRQEIEVRYTSNFEKREVNTLREINRISDKNQQVIKEQGVYWITGGMGGIGLIFAKHILASGNVKLILSGRSVLSNQNNAILEEMRNSGADVLYLKNDVSSPDSVAESYNTIKETYGRIDGIIHCAGITRDSLILKKNKKQIKSVLAPKVRGAVLLDEVTRNENLDFLVFFSSLSGSTGNIGQADYSAANAFLDAYAVYRQSLVGAGKRNGRSLSIGWPLWKDGGMKIDQLMEERLKDSSGMIPLESATGTAVFADMLKSRYNHMIVCQGELEKMRKAFLGQVVQDLQLEDGEKIQSVMSDKELEKRSIRFLKEILASSIKIDPQRIDSEAPLENFGFDSIMIIELTDQLEKVFGPLSKTLLFEYQTIKELSSYFVTSYRDTLEKEFEDKKIRPPVFQQDNNTVSDLEVDIKRSSGKRSRFISYPSEKVKSSNVMDVAIIGISGRYPEAENIEEFWKNLENGRDCINEIPPERWDYKKFFDPDRNKTGKVHSKWGGFLKDIDKFDPLFFNISPREAEYIEPQERIFLETAWATLEDAGYTREYLKQNLGFGFGKRVGVYVGIMYEEYQLFGAEETLKGRVIALPGNPAGIANRVSYILNFHGPSMAVDSMCSSSLTTIHLACQSLKTGECDLALAGGVNLSIHPHKYIQLSQGKFASTKGRCESFGKGDGYVPSEGVGCLLLKPLKKAEEDKDHIYGVIKGTALNHGGKTNGYTVPNPNAQGALISSALKNAGINPRSISYIEAHGTGTALGDPIEIAGLTKAFREQTRETGYCSIGSVKSNIGHCESAAGVAGVTKVLLQMKHKKLVPSIHSKELNPDIDFLSTPFRVQQDFAEWNRPVVRENGRDFEYPRRAGVSSFGAGGANAHVIIEEYNNGIMLNSDIDRDDSQDPVLVVLSARNQERLRIYVKRFIDYLNENKKIDLAAFAYTLQVGRLAMETRLALTAENSEEVVNKLDSYLQRKEHIDGFYFENTNSIEGELSYFSSEEDRDDTFSTWMAEKKLDKIGEFWVKGFNLKWDLLYAEEKPRRLSLPTYPFERDTYWIPETQKAKPLPEANWKSFLHPLVGKNQSTFEQQKFSTSFNGKELFVDDHRVAGEKVFPAACYIEMARAAGQISCGKNIALFNNTVLAQSIKVTEKQEIFINLYPGDERMFYEITTLNDQLEPVIHCQGEMRTGSPESEGVLIDPVSIKSRCPDRIKGPELYKHFSDLGVFYGPFYRGIKKIYTNSTEVIAELEILQKTNEEFDGFLLNPAFFDSALQSVIGLFLEPGKKDAQAGKLLIPYSFEEVKIFGALPEKGFAYTVFSPGYFLDDNIFKFDISVTDEKGKVLIQIKEFACRNFYQKTNAGKEQIVEKHEPVSSDGKDEEIKELLEEYFKKRFSSILKIPAGKIDSGAPLEKYGIDSILTMELTSDLEKVFGPLSKTLFFEYRSIDTLCVYFLKSYRNAVTELLGLNGRREDDEASNRKKSLPSISPLKLKLSAGLPTVMKGGNVHEDIAVIGIAGRYPQAENLSEFWENLIKGRDCVTEIPETRWDYKFYFDENKNKFGKIYSKWGGFIKDFDKFDSLFFNISPLEAEIMDPQERIFLEVAWETLEDAGYTRNYLEQSQGFGLDKHVGVYVGVMYDEYQLFGGDNTLEGKMPAIAGNPAGIANRVSYLLNLHGPSMSVNTMCSSSLTSLHLACQDIRNGHCCMALAGGVNLSIHPNKYFQISQGKFASSKGRCESFGEGGDGYVPGEGVGCLLLKPLSQALQDHDQIYGIVKGTSLNHGGKTNGYTVPNPSAQGAVIKQALKKAGINPRTISYVEAHGTGTSLGDPIEITGLVNAFREFTDESGFCSIGSVKSNIGHLESAAGVASVTKVLLQMKYKKLVPSLHSRVLNPNINFEVTPFIVQQDLTDWHCPVIRENGGMVKYPRRAGISSFGAGGSNVHIILEEFVPVDDAEENIKLNTGDAVIIPLSAKNKERLDEYVRRLIRFLEQEPEPALRDVAYTLQIGRENLESRVALIVRTHRELITKLKAFVEKEKDIHGCYSGNVNKEKESIALFMKDSEDLVKKWVKTGKMEKIAELWVRGANFDWNLLHPRVVPGRISLPTYPFKRDRYWISMKAQSGPDKRITGKSAAWLHPFIEQNISDFQEQKFAARFMGDESFIKDYLIAENKMVPGVLFPEMARAAGVIASKEEVFHIKDIIWSDPLRLDGDFADIVLSLFPRKNRTIFEVASTDDSGCITIRSRGFLYMGHRKSPYTGEKISIEDIQARCTSELNGSNCYLFFESEGLSYGTAYQNIIKILFNEKEILVELKPSVNPEGEGVILIPEVFEGISQAATCFIREVKDEAAEKVERLLPFSLSDLSIYKALEGKNYIYMTLEPEKKSERKIFRFNVQIIDEAGFLKVLFKDFVFKALDKNVVGQKKKSSLTGLVYAANEWKVKNIPDEPLKLDDPCYSVLFIASGESSLVEYISSVQPDVKLISLAPCQATGEAVEELFIRVFNEVKEVSATGDKKKLRFLFVAFSKESSYLYSCLSGLFKTAKSENPEFSGKIIYCVEAIAKDRERVTSLIRQELSGETFEDVEIKYDENFERREVRRFSEFLFPGSFVAGPHLLEDGGVYWITGGMGGLGKIFAEYFAKLNNSSLILSGRSALDSEKRDYIRKLGNDVCYLRADVSIKADVEKVFAEIKKRYGKLNGIIHSAGVLRDSFIIKKSESQIKDVFRPKVHGVFNLDEVTQKEDLDFMVLFSSLAGVFGNMGQSDYSSANALLDAFACYRQELVDKGERRGKTISINWPLWKDGGMRVNAHTENMMRQSVGMTPMKVANGLEAFSKILHSGVASLLVMEGYPANLKKYLFGEETVSVSLPNNSKLVKEKTMAKIRKVFAAGIKLDESEIKPDESFENYGINSVMVMDLNDQLEEIFGIISKTLFYEYQTIEDLSCYFIENYHQQCLEWTGLDKVKETAFSSVQQNFSEENEMADGFPEILPEKRTGQLSRNFFSVINQEPVAIIGVDGKYPGAADIYEYWDNLKNGKDCISEIPEDRWSLEGFFSPDRQKAGSQGRSYSKWGGFVDGYADFDPLFFNISPLEAMNMDPQERLFLQSCWSVLEDAGYSRKELSRRKGDKIGIFVGVTKNTFQLYGRDVKDRSFFPNSLYWTIANRVSYLFDFHGPSIPVDTACSSSLTAVHEACEYIRRGECELAIAGGVNLYLHPSSYIMLCANQMLASDGKCKSFGAGGNGFVPGEGVGTLLLKPLNLAEADGDHIYGVIRGTAINHGGKTTGYTVPNPKAQGDVVIKALENANLKFSDISYIEAHGTGTVLGDPIEIDGLKKVFKKQPESFSSCSIGSVKSNIGHLEAAAGVAGITKILLQFKYKKIVPSLHSGILNPNIDFESFPFVVQQKLEDWNVPLNEETGEKRSRIAGISSFGAGGANAHIILEEYNEKSGEPPHPQKRDFSGEVIVPLSAKTEKQLKLYARRIAGFIQQNMDSRDFSVSDIAYTLQVGREHMKNRLAVFAGNKEDLLSKLYEYSDGKKSIEGIYSGNSRESSTSIKNAVDEDDLTDIFESWIINKKYHSIVKLWVGGVDFDWMRLYPENWCRRVSLPTYPFIKERYWIPKNKSEDFLGGDFVTEGNNKRKSSLVAGIDFKASLKLNNGFVFETFLCPDDVFLRDHIVSKEPVLPGVCYLELSLGAARRIFPDKQYNIKNVVWIQPLSVTAKCTIKMALRSEENGFQYEIISLEKNEKKLHSSGFLEENSKPESNECFDLVDLKQRLSCLWDDKSGKENFYRGFKNTGIEYGPYFQRIEALWSGENEVLGMLSCNDVPGSGEFFLHPGLLDCALQCAAGFNATVQTCLPFSLGEVQYEKPLSGKMYSYIRKVSNLRYHLSLLDEKGGVCVRIRDFEVRPVKKPVDKMLLVPCWVREPLKKTEKASPEKGPLKTVVIYHKACYGLEEALVEYEGPENCILCMLGGQVDDREKVPYFVDVKDQNGMSRVIKAIPGIEKIYFLGGLYEQKGSLLDHAYQEKRNEYGVISFFRLIKALLAGEYVKKSLDITVVTGNCQSISGKDEVEPGGAGLIGLVQSLAKEYIDWKIKSIDFSTRELMQKDKKEIVKILDSEPANSNGQGIAYRNYQRYIPKMIKLMLPEINDVPFKKNGVYVILGGAGGIGYSLSQLIARKYEAEIIWIGRRAIDNDIRNKVEKIAKEGISPVYVQADATSLSSMENALKQIKNKFNTIDGVIHSAIVLNDKSLADMTEERFISALGPKVEGSINLCKVFAKENPDWFCFFSSVQSFIGARGQSNYAAGCTFKDAFAHALRQDVSCPVHIINWGYWGSVGVVAKDQYRQRMARHGISSIEPEEGLDILEKVISNKIDQIVPMKVMNMVKK